jgi:hypothetical protein
VRLGPEATPFLNLGVEIEWMPDGRIKLSHSRYVDRILEHFDMHSRELRH